MTRRICVVLTTRGNYAKMKSTMSRLANDPRVALQVVAGGAVLDSSYGDHSKAIEADGFKIAARLDYIESGKTLQSVTESAARCTSAMGRILAHLQPDWLMVVADRYEALSIAQSGLCQNIRIAHLEGGETSGSIDERIRHAVSKLAHLHFPSNEDAALRLRKLGEPAEAIHVVGTPSLDTLAGVDLSDRSAPGARLARAGEGREVDLDQDYIVISQHPVVTEYADAARQFAETAAAVREIGLPAVWILPNDDAGANAVKAPLQELINDSSAPPIGVIGSMPFTEYAALLTGARCLLGNSSSGVRESAFLGVPVVNIGTRQNGRYVRSRNVMTVGYDAQAIAQAARRQIAHGRYPSDTVFGDGHAGERIAAVITEAWPPLDKAIAY
jgi:UDP-hydrolysing UDP-N-acetyl-D-glucosamine 2-epimerase